MKTTTTRISGLLASALMLFGALGSVACDDKDKPEPVYKNPEGLLLTTFEAAYNCEKGVVNTISYLIFYSDSFPITTLEGYTLNLHPLSENQFYLLHWYYDHTDYTPSTSILFPLIWGMNPEGADKLNLPNCNKHNVKNIVYVEYYVPEDGQYDFFFRIENPEKGIYYQTPNYRYTKTTKDGLYTTSISIIN